VVSFGVYAAFTTALPAVAPVKLTVQVEVVALKAVRVQLVGLNEPVAVLAAPRVKATVPSGAEAVPEAVSFTDAVQEDAWATGTLEGVQTTVVEVARPPVTFTGAVPKLVA
jgi:hypothetical protein